MQTKTDMDTHMFNINQIENKLLTLENYVEKYMPLQNLRAVQKVIRKLFTRE